MSLLSNILLTKKRLKPTKTIITTIDGKSMTKDGKILTTGGNGFVLDNKPDNIPCQILDGLFLGSQDCVDLIVLESRHINNILSIGVDVPIDLPLEFNVKFIGCLDLPETDINVVMNEACVFIHQILQKKRKVLVNCNAGVSRSSAIIIGYLILHKNMNFDEAYKFVKLKRECIRPNDGFIRQLKELQNK